MDVHLTFHMEIAEDGDHRAFVRWVESDELPGLSVAASSLNELRTAFDEAIADLSADNAEPIVVASETLAGATMPTPSQPTAIESGEESTAAAVSQILISA